jgi:hypothetical protein
VQVNRYVRHVRIARPEWMKMIGIGGSRLLNRADAKVAKKTRFKSQTKQQVAAWLGLFNNRTTSFLRSLRLCVFAVHLHRTFRAENNADNHGKSECFAPAPNRIKSASQRLRVKNVDRMIESGCKQARYR